VLDIYCDCLSLCQVWKAKKQVVGGLTDRNLEFRRIISNTDLRKDFSKRNDLSLSLSVSPF
jgi:hypothetical protein